MTGVLLPPTVGGSGLKHGTILVDTELFPSPADSRRERIETSKHGAWGSGDGASPADSRRERIETGDGHYPDPVPDPSPADSRRERIETPQPEPRPPAATLLPPTVGGSGLKRSWRRPRRTYRKPSPADSRRERIETSVACGFSGRITLLPPTVGGSGLKRLPLAPLLLAASFSRRQSAGAD